MVTPNQIINADNVETLRTFPDDCIDSIVTDPPYGLSFMGKRWDYDVPSVELWQECLRVLKPGGHLLAFAGTRTQHRMAVRIEDAGFEIRDMIAWVYGSGFPKSLDVSKAIDKAAGAEREVIGQKVRGDVERAKSSGVTMAAADANKNNKAIFGYGVENITVPATEAAKQWQGFGTALKPALEPITVARKPLCGTVAENVLQWGTGALNIDGCRVGNEQRTYSGMSANKPEVGTFRDDNWTPKEISVTVAGRWPANLIHDGSDEVNSLLKESARFFYCAKANKKDRGEGNNHPTVKPTDLMRYLVRLVTPPNGVVLDPFMGSGSTGKACVLEGFNFIGIDRNKEYVAIAKTRILAAKKGK